MRSVQNIQNIHDNIQSQIVQKKTNEQVIQYQQFHRCSIEMSFYINALFVSTKVFRSTYFYTQYHHIRREFIDKESTAFAEQNNPSKKTKFQLSKTQDGYAYLYVSFLSYDASTVSLLINYWLSNNKFQSFFIAIYPEKGFMQIDFAKCIFL